MFPELRIAPPVAHMQDFMERFRPWCEAVLGCRVSEAVTFELETPLGQFAAEELLQGVTLDKQCLSGAAALRSFVVRWELPPGVSPRIELLPSRNRKVLIMDRELAWDPHWKETPVAAWLSGLQHGIIAANIPFVSFANGLVHKWRAWLLVNRCEVTQALNLLRGITVESRRQVTVLGGRSFLLPPAGCTWDTLVLAPATGVQLREDFEAFLQREAWFRRHDLPFRRGYLFHGPPGNGKTSVLRVMASHPLLSAFTVDFSNEELSNDALTLLFEEAGQSAPALVFFEDLDRLYGESCPTENRTKITLQHLLNCLDGLGTHDGIIVVATANDPTQLGSALLRRPGRFDRVVPFLPPNGELRREYLTRLTSGTLDPDRLEQAVEQTKGFSFAQLREAYVSSCGLAFEEGAEGVRLTSILEGIRLVRCEARDIAASAGKQTLGFGLGRTVCGGSRT